MFSLNSSVGRLSINGFQIHRTHVLTTSTEKITLKTHLYLILHQFNAISLFSNIFIFTSLAINYYSKL